MHHRQNGGDRIFSEQLLAGHNYDNKAEGVAEVFQQNRPILQFDVKIPFASKEAPIDRPAAIADHSRASASRSISFPLHGEYVHGSPSPARKAIFIYFDLFTTLIFLTFHFSFVILCL